MRCFPLRIFLSLSAIVLICSWRCGEAEPSTAPVAPQGLVRLLGSTGLRIGKPWAFTPDGTGLFTIGDNSIHLWNSAAGTLLRTYSETSRIFYAARSGDGEVVAGCTGNQITLWRVATGEKVASVPVPEGWALSPALSHDGKTVAWIMPNFKGISVRDVASGAEIARFSPDAIKDGNSFLLQFSPDGSILAEGASGAGAVVANLPTPFSATRLWDIAGKKLKLQFKADEAGIPAFAFSPDGKRLVSGCHGLHLWDVASGKELDKVAPAAGSANTHLAWVKGGRLLAVKLDANGACAVDRFDLTGDRFRVGTSNALPHPASVFSDDGRFVAYGEAGACVVETAKGTPFGDNAAPVVAAKHTAFTGDGSQVVTICEDGAIFVWETSNGRLLRRFDMPIPHIASAALSADGSTFVAVTTDDARIYAYSMVTGKQLYIAGSGNKERMALAALTPDGKRLAGAGQVFDQQMHSVLCVWNGQAGGAAKFERSVPTFNINAMCWSPDASSIAVGGYDGNIRLFDGATGAEKVTLRQRAAAPAPDPNAPPDFNQSIVTIDMSADGQVLAATNNDGDLVLWETYTGKLVRRIPKIDATVPRIRFDPRGFVLATQGLDGAINFWEVATGVKIATLQCGSGVQAWNFSPDGQFIVTAGNPGENAIWKSPLSVPSGATAMLPVIDAKEFDKLWTDLADPDAGQAFHAARVLAGRGESALKFLAEHLAFSPPPDATRTKASALIHDLSADEFKTRRSAERQLREISAAAHPILIESSKQPESIDSRMALNRILSDGPPITNLSPQDARYLRAISAVEQIRGPQAMKLLETVWETSTNAHATAEARAALGRLRTRSESETK